MNLIAYQGFESIAVSGSASYPSNQQPDAVIVPPGGSCVITDADGTTMTCTVAAGGSTTVFPFRFVSIGTVTGVAVQAAYRFGLRAIQSLKFPFPIPTAQVELSALVNAYAWTRRALTASVGRMALATTGRVIVSVANISSYALTRFGTGLGAQVARVRVASVVSGVCQVMPAVRLGLTNTGNGYGLICTSGSLQVVKMTGDVIANVGSAFTSPVLAKGDTVALSARGTNLEVFVNGVSLGTPVSDATYATGVPGIANCSALGTSGSIDFFAGGDDLATA